MDIFGDIFKNMKQIFTKLVEESIIFWDLVEMLNTNSQNYDVTKDFMKVFLLKC